MQEDDIQSLENADIQTSNKVIDLPDTSLENKQLQKLINNHLDQIPEDFRTVFLLRAIEQCSVKETAETLQIKQETVKTRYFRAKHLLRMQLQLYIESAGMQVYEFGGHHCDILVFNVLSHIHLNPEKTRD